VVTRREGDAIVEPRQLFVMPAFDSKCMQSGNSVWLVTSNTRCVSHELLAAKLQHSMISSLVRSKWILVSIERASSLVYGQTHREGG
jgi:hypothetical protein